MALESERLDLKLDINGDLEVPGSGPSWAAGLDGVVQLCRIAMQQFEGEWFADLDYGVPWFQDILGGKPTAANIERARNAFRAALVSVPGVLRVETLTLNFTGPIRTLDVRWQVQTIFGDSNIEATEV